MKLCKAALPAFYSGAALVVAGCGFSGSPADGLRFQPPPGWHSSKWVMGFMQFWSSPSEREVIMLFRSPKPLPAGDVFSNQQMQQRLKDVTVVRHNSTVICGNQPATYIQAQGSSSRGGDDTVEMITTAAQGTSYMAMYVRPMGSAPNPSAETALRQLCPK